MTSVNYEIPVIVDFEINAATISTSDRSNILNCESFFPFTHCRSHVGDRMRQILSPTSILRLELNDGVPSLSTEFFEFVANQNILSFRNSSHSVIDF